MPAISIIIVSHNKPEFVGRAIQSVLSQTLTDWEGFLVDSGVLLKQGFFDYIKDTRLKIMPSGEDPGMGLRLNMAGWCFNKILSSGAVTGELILYLCDDDYYYPQAFETFWNYYKSHDGKPQAMYASLDLGVIDASGKTTLFGQRIADHPRGRFCNGLKLDCKVDYLQFCHSRKILEKFREAYPETPYHCEDKNQAFHADGLFMEQIGALTQVYPVIGTIGVNCRTASSVNCGVEAPKPDHWTRLMERRFRKWWRRKLGLKDKDLY